MRAFGRVFVCVTKTRTPESEAGNETETARGARQEKRERERGRLLWYAFSRDAAPDRKSGSHALCRSVLVAQQGTHALSLHRAGPQSATCPCVWTPKKGARLFLLVEHASRLPVPSIARHEEVSLSFLALCHVLASSLSYLIFGPPSNHNKITLGLRFLSSQRTISSAPQANLDAPMTNCDLILSDYANNRDEIQCRASEGAAPTKLGIYVLGSGRLIIA